MVVALGEWRWGFSRSSYDQKMDEGGVFVLLKVEGAGWGLEGKEKFRLEVRPRRNGGVWVWKWRSHFLNWFINTKG